MTRPETLMQHLPAEIDAALVQSDISRQYLTGFASTAGSLLCFRDETILIIDFRYLEMAREKITGITILEQENLWQQITTLLQAHGVKTLAIESEQVTLHDFAVLQARLGDHVTLEKSDALSKAISAMRAVKSPEEIEKIQAAEKIAEDALTDLTAWLRPGVSEWEVMLKLNALMLEHGSEGESFPTIALTGAATSMPHGVPTRERVVRDGDFVLLDFGAIFGGYHSDITRTIPVGTPSEKMKRVYDIVLSAQEAALSVAKSGITGAELDAAARNVIAQAGFGDAFGHALGHGVGLEIHEAPTAAPRCKDEILPAGSIITIEPGIYLPGEFGVRIEDCVILEENGAKNITFAAK